VVDVALSELVSIMTIAPVGLEPSSAHPATQSLVNSKRSNPSPKDSKKRWLGTWRGIDRKLRDAERK
jgi:hypothetical protein